VLLLLFYLTPIFYTISLVKTRLVFPLSAIYIYNPFVGILNLYRSALLKDFYYAVYNETGAVSLIIVPICFAVAVFLFGIYLYKINKDSINDYLY